ncbi:MAG: hypothetical protein H6977_03255 [Gammaproteobacteria bacterium]|nr:hypothetical protein [Gammaproteobacteria bacterium]MCP5199005.1 hypothetical protein [Gammaproteobacteria bacterium]
MADANFAVVFRGRLVEGAEPAAVRANLATLFKADAARIEKMFSGQTVIIKKGLDEAGAKKYLAVLAKAGALAEMARTTPKAAEPAASAATPATAAPVASAAAPARPLAATAPPQTIPSAYADGSPPAAIEASVDEPGVVLVDYQAPAAPDIATEHLSMAEPGVTLVEAGHVPEPEYDLSALTLDPPGTTLVEAAHVEPPEYEFEGLSVADNA